MVHDNSHPRSHSESALQILFKKTEEPGIAHILGTNRETLVKCFQGIRSCSSKKVTWLIAQLKCIFTTTCSMGYKQEELEATVQLES